MKLSTTSFAAGAVAALVIGSGSAYAATGGNFILGKSNSAGATTTLSNANGTALSLNSKSGTAPLKVNRTTKVANLNADLLDNLDQSAFARRAGTTRAYDVVSDAYDFLPDGAPDGKIDTLVAGAQCPAGTHRTGGGFWDLTTSGKVAINSADSQNPQTWFIVVPVNPDVAEDPMNAGVTIVCESPTGTPPANDYGDPGYARTTGGNGNSTLPNTVTPSMIAAAQR
ncbi:hypothetical protein GCM10011584_11310 [Nocardioides phosphati]|uniref:Uncharacterized protein n=1 Tax=Nocardioides phosphati TaxID=1867775 RepID=A0ABQ2N7A6_9ACTN|nr:hypothetical protein [Nocardioides phosphati]GGO87221.1 hypothetical protein GCM10011584_11310 [Nocardioides phosphati]